MSAASVRAEAKRLLALSLEGGLVGGGVQLGVGGLLGLADAQAATQRLAEAQKAAAAKLNAASDEAAKILADARNAAKAAVEAAKAEATAAQTEVIAKAKAAIEADRVKMLAEVRGEVSRLVVETAAKVLEQNLDDAQRGRLNEAAVKQLAR